MAFFFARFGHFSFFVETGQRGDGDAQQTNAHASEGDLAGAELTISTMLAATGMDSASSF